MLQSSQPSGHRLQISVKFSVPRLKWDGEQRNPETREQKRLLKFPADSHSLVLGVRRGKGAPQCSHADQLPPATSCFHPAYGCVGGLACSRSWGSPWGGRSSASGGHCTARGAFRGAGGGRTSFFPVMCATGSLDQTLPSCKLLVPLQSLCKADEERQCG